MITTSYAKDMALYNKWQNETLYILCEKIGDSARRLDRKMFFKSIHNTLNHILTIDVAIMTFLQTGIPQAITFNNFPFDNFDSLREARIAFDQKLLALPNEVEDTWFSSFLEFDSESLARKRRIPRSFMLGQMFNHQTHHRSQITSEFYKMGIDYGNTDLPYNPYVNY